MAGGANSSDLEICWVTDVVNMLHRRQSWVSADPEIFWHGLWWKCHDCQLSSGFLVTRWPFYEVQPKELRFCHCSALAYYQSSISQQSQHTVQRQQSVMKVRWNRRLVKLSIIINTYINGWIARLYLQTTMAWSVEKSPLKGKQSSSFFEVEIVEPYNRFWPVK